MLKRSLVIRVLAISFLFIALPLLLYSFIFFKRMYNEAVSSALLTLKDAAIYRTFALEEVSPFPSAFLKQIALFTNLDKEISNLPNPAFDQKLKELMQALGNKYDILILSPREGEGLYKILASNLDNEVERNFISFTRMKLIQEKKSGSFIRFYYDNDLKRAIPYFYSGIVLEKEGSQETLGFILVRSNVEPMMKEILTPTKEENIHISFAFLHHSGYVEAATDPELAGQLFTEISLVRQFQLLVETHRVNLDFFSTQPLPVFAETPESSFFEFKWQDEMMLAAIAPNSQIGDTILAYSLKREVFGGTLKRFILIYSLFGVMIVLGGILALWLSKWMSRPLDQMVALMKNIREGKYFVRFKPEPLGFEINFLGNTFNDMVTSLLENIERAEDEKVKKETYKKEIEIGQKVQRGLLPQKMPENPSVEIAATYFAPEEVGGDFYDIFQLGNNLYLICADAAGVGISSSLYSLGIKSLIRAYSTIYDDVGTIMALTNNDFCEDTGETGMFVTAIMGVYNIKTKVLTYHSAGHVPGLIRKREGRVITLEERGMALGLLRTNEFNAAAIHLDPQDIVVFYTDGLTDAVNEKNQHFSERRLKNLLRQRPWNAPKEIVAGLQSEWEAFTLNTIQDEEVAILVMKIK